MVHLKKNGVNRVEMLVRAGKISQNVAIIGLLVDFAYFLTDFVKFDLQYALCFCTKIQ